MITTSKCAIIGCGFVGAACAYSLTHSGVFSEIVMIDKNKKKANGEAMDIADALPFTSPAKIYAGDYYDTRDCSVIIIAAGYNQTGDESRLDLVKKNTEIAKLYHAMSVFIFLSLPKRSQNKLYPVLILKKLSNY